MKNKKKYILIIFIILIIIGIIFFIFRIKAKSLNQSKKISTEPIIETDIILSDDLTVEFGKIKYLSDYVTINNAELVDQKIEYEDLGEKTIKYYANYPDMKREGTITLNIVDTTEPLVMIGSNLTYLVGEARGIDEDIFCMDNHDNNPDCHFEGDFDLTIPGDYPVKFVAKDSSENIFEKEVTISVVENSIIDTAQTSKTKTYFSDVYNTYKNDNTEIGIDVSKWQGDIDFERVKNAGASFVMIRMGVQNGIDGELYLDKYFVNNITKAKEAGLKVGLYFYSCAITKEEAVNQANWVLEQIKDYEIDLPIVYDWETWSKHTKFQLSLFEITQIQKIFLDIISKNGYEGARYGSKNYLTNAWQDSEYKTWLAHYVANTNYEGEYFMWQRCNNGRIDGINGDVDIDILYQ